jgi:hypothetical protein
VIVVVRNVARARRRGFGRFAIFAGTLTLFAAAPAAALASSETVIGLSLARVSTGKEALAIRGASDGSETAHFSAVATLSRIPCPGVYRYSLHSEKQDTGALSSYTATVALRPIGSDLATPCGGIPPPRSGALHISMSGDEETINFGEGRGSGSGGFFGVFTMGMQPECKQRFTISVSVDLRGWDRSVRYLVEVANWKSEAQGRRLESHDCA